ncbi:phage tail family protein (plasmid) [Piscirickettsia salmonis]|uniref:Phage tail family protein n=1 Tax=Piscirickettsia salmonis TaxID=1238 RepID=A0AAC8ZQ85_PISSA|nr:hypothetical protein [Piscirickettsia salmonis]ALB24735.1 phage tail family protein [Piscirickettsia salmonis]
MLGDFASLDVQNTYRGSDAYAEESVAPAMRYSGMLNSATLLKPAHRTHSKRVGCTAAIQFNMIEMGGFNV